jgi:anti-sigma regulatory factor (Ser/Thr protein kinase)
MKSITLPAAWERLPELRVFLTADLPESFQPVIPSLELALEELLVNIHHYAYDEAGGSVELSCRLANFDGQPHLIILVRDWGRAFDPFADSPQPDLTSSLEDRPIGGLGLHLIRRMASHCCYSRCLGANATELFFLKPD